MQSSSRNNLWPFYNTFTKPPKSFMAFATSSPLLKLIFNENVYITKWLSAGSSFKMKKSMNDFQ